jgi:hypothetical protein
MPKYKKQQRMILFPIRFRPSTLTAVDIIAAARESNRSLEMRQAVENMVEAERQANPSLFLTSPLHRCSADTAPGPDVA